MYNMNIYKYKNILTLLLVFLHTVIISAKTNLPSTKFEYITIENGLPQNTVQCIEKDQYGYMWFGTDNGLCRYDGYDFYYFEAKKDSGLIDNRIIDITTDNNGYLWIITPKGGQIFNLLTERFESFQNQAINKLLHKKIKQIKNINNVLWAVTQDSGIFKITSNTDIEAITISDVYFTKNDLPQVISIYKGYNNNVFLGTEKGVYQLNNDKNSFELLTFNHIDNTSLYAQAILEDKSNIWIGTLNGAFKINKETNDLRWYAHDPLNKHTISHSSVTCIEKDKKGDILLGTLAGIHKYNAEADNFNKIILHQGKHTNIHDIFIRSILTDSIGNVWIATEKTGVIHFNIFQKNFYSFQESNANLRPLNESIINSIYKDNNRLWVGTAGNGIIQYDNKGDKIYQYKNEINKPSSLQSNFVTSIIKGSDGKIWAATWGKGIQILTDAKNNVFKGYYIRDGLPSDFISCYYFCKDGQLLVGTKAGIAIYDNTKKKFHTVKITSNMQTAPWEVGCIIEDNDGFLWIGTTNGLHRFSKKSISPDYQLSNYDITTFKESADFLSLPNNYITCLEKDKEGNIWIGTYGNGISKCISKNNKTFQFANLSTKNGLANNVVYRILSDDKNNLWISTENGLSNYIQNNNTFQNYYTKDGLRNNQYYWNAAYKSSNGILYFGGMNGLNYFNPDSIKSYHFKVPTYITDLKIFNKSIKPLQKRNGLVPLHKSIFATDTIMLSFKDNVFSFEFSSLPYFSTSKIKYAYQLEGVDKDFVIVPSDRRIASYTNLKGGEYTFTVKSTNTEGKWINDPTKVVLIVKPPFYKTTWFKYLLFITVLLLIYGYIKYRSFRLSVQKKRLEEIVEIRTNELNEKNAQLEVSTNTLLKQNTQLAQRKQEIEKQKTLLENQNKEIITQRDTVLNLNKEIESIHQMRMQFFTNISHEFRTPLTLIIAPVERLLQSNLNLNKEEFTKTLQYVKRNTERLLLLTTEIMKFRKFETGKIKLTLYQGNIGDFINEIAEAFRPIAHQKKLNFHVSIDFNLKDLWYDKNKLEDILFNLLSNAMKYTPPKGEVSLNVSQIVRDNNKQSLFINIKDTGIGISEEAKKKVFDRFYRADSNSDFSTYGTGIGLAITKQNVETMNGSITLDSEINKGSSFKVFLPVNEADFPEHDKSQNVEVSQVALKERVNLLVDIEPNENTVKINLNHTNSDNGTIKPKILIVDDNNDLREFVAEALNPDYVVYTAVDGEQGLKEALEKEPDLILSDIMMPKINGLDMCKQLKNNLHTSHLPIILLTAKGQEDDFVEGLQTGADDYISKPFNLSVLKAKIDSLIENRKKLKRMFHNAEGEINAETVTTNTVDEEFMEKINKVVAENYTNPSFDIDSFASKMYVSRSLLYKKLKALTNVSPNEYVNIYRLKKSVQLLKNKNVQISEVAFQIGFNDPKYFSRVFKKFYNCSPSAYGK